MLANNNDARLPLDPSTELKLRPSLRYGETMGFSDEVDSLLIRAWLVLPKERAKSMDQTKFDKKLEPQCRRQLLLEMIADRNKTSKVD